MANAREIRLKIRSVQNTKKITKAMEMVAASKMRKTQDRMRKAIPYARKILEVISHIALGHTEYKHPFMQNREIKTVGYIVVTTDRGLCGGLNTNLLKAVVKSVKEQTDQGRQVKFAVLGGKGMSFFKRMGGEVLAHKKDLGDQPELIDLIGITRAMLDAYLAGEVDAIYICSNEFVSTMKQDPKILQVVPLVPATEERISHHWDYIYEPDDAQQLLDKLLTRYVESLMYRAVIENIASEQAARMLAMRNATSNAEEQKELLQLVYNKARQAAITRELSEIVAGASVI